MLFAALAVDVGSWYVKAQDIQRAADAAAARGRPVHAGLLQRRRDQGPRGRGQERLHPRRQRGHRQRRTGAREPTPVEGDGHRPEGADLLRHHDPWDQITVAQDRNGGVRPACAPRQPTQLPGYRKPRHRLRRRSTPEFLWASVNGYCTGKEQGDQRASFYLLKPQLLRLHQRRVLSTSTTLYSIELPDYAVLQTPT